MSLISAAFQTSATPGATVRLRNATVGYDRHPAVHHVDGVFEAGSLTAVVGPNGGGKSTLLKSIAGALRPMDGRVDVEGCRRRQIAYLPQQAEVDRTFPLPVFDFVALGLWGRVGLFKAFRRRDDEEVARALAVVGLAGFESRTLDTLSGGQVQRVLFARLMLQDAPLILLDEPFTAVDERTIGDLMGLVQRWHGEGRTVIAVLHDMAQVRSRFPKALLIARRVLAWGATAGVLTPDHLAEARAMQEAWDERAPVCHGQEAAE